MGSVLAGIPTSRGSGTVGQKAGLHQFGTSGVNKKLQAGAMRNSALQIPQRLAIAMIDSEKWCLRNDIIWYKRNGQPNTSSNRFGLGDYEHIYFFTKQSTEYYFKPHYEPFKSSSSSSSTSDKGKQKHKRQVWDIPTHPNKEQHYSQFPQALCNLCIDAGCPESPLPTIVEYLLIVSGLDTQGRRNEGAFLREFHYQRTNQE